MVENIYFGHGLIITSAHCFPGNISGIVADNSLFHKTSRFGGLKTVIVSVCDEKMHSAFSGIVVWNDLAPARANGKLKLPNKTTDAALQYLLTGDPDAWEHLLQILNVAKGNLFLQEPGLTPLTATRRFFEGWLLERLAPYREADADTIHAAAERGEFQYLGKQATNVLIDELRRRGASEDALDQHLSEEEWWAGQPARVVSLDAPLDDDGGFTLACLLAIDPGPDDSSVSKEPSALGMQPGLEPHTLQRTIQNGEAEFKRLLGPSYDVLVTISDLFVVCPDDLRTGDAARAVSGARDVSLQTARKKLGQLAATFRRALGSRNPTVRDLFAKLIAPGRAAFSILDHKRRVTQVD